MPRTGLVVLLLSLLLLTGAVSAQQPTPTPLPGIPGAVTPRFAFTPPPSATPTQRPADAPVASATPTATPPASIAPATVTPTATLVPPPSATARPTLPPTATRPPLPEQLQAPVLEEVLVGGDFVVSLPPWTIIRAAGFATRAQFVEAVQLAYALLLPIAPLDPALVEVAALAALRPVAIEGVPVLVVVGFFPLDALAAELDTTPAAFAPGQLLNVLGYGTLRPLVQNGRAAAVGVVSPGEAAFAPTATSEPVDAASPRVPPPPALWQAAAAVVFPEDNLVGVVLLQAPERYRDAEAFALPVLLSLRKAGEPLDVNAVIAVLGITEATPVPPDAPSAIPSATPTLAASATPVPSPTASATATPTPEPCVLTAFQGANLRGGPGTGFRVRGVLNVGQQATADGQTTAEGFVWWRLASGLWVRSDLVRESGPCAALPQAR